MQFKGGMLVGKDGMPIESLAVMAGKEAPVRVAPGRACMRCAYIKVQYLFEFHVTDADCHSLPDFISIMCRCVVMEIALARG